MAKPNRIEVPQGRKSRLSAFMDEDVLRRYDESAGVHALEKGDNVITMFGIVGEDPWSDEYITAKRVAAQLKAIGDRDVEVHINSPGGDVFEGIAIFNILREHPQNVTIKVMGLAASAASVIAMAGDRVEIGEASFLMIHNTWIIAIGNQHDLREAADYIAPFDNALRDLYAARTGHKAAEIQDWMNAETFFSAEEAIELGFADAKIEKAKLAVDEKAKARHNDLNAVRAMESSMVAGGMTRQQAKARISAFKEGLRDATPEPKAGETQPTQPQVDLDAVRALIDDMKEG